MKLTNRDVFAVDPTAGDIPNLGVVKVSNPEDAADWATLEWELRNFVCEGEYERGLELILSQFLSHMTQPEQPAAWVSGYYGSGKSHLMRVLEYLWRDYQLPSGQSARGLTKLDPDIEAHLVELSAVAKRAGGLWSAAGKMGEGASGSVRLAFLGIVFLAAGLPEDYASARLAIWLKSEGLYDQVESSVTAAERMLSHELRNMYVSPVLAAALIDAGATFGTTPAEVSVGLQNQFPGVDDVSNSETVDVFEEVLRLQSTTKDKMPLTLVVLDEMQQYVDDDGKVAEHVQFLVEACSARFGSQILFVATGQEALTSTTTLRKLMGRFTVNVGLQDTDVETVVRRVVLLKKPDAIAPLEAQLGRVSGEIDRQLGGTKLEATAADKATLVADYPLLPTRRRFWEKALRAIDRAGTAGVLRTQLKIVHDAASSAADQPLGHVVGADFLFTSESASMRQSGALAKEIEELIRGLADGTPDGELKSRACALIFLISQLPRDGIGDTGLRATAAVIADLLVEDLENDGAVLRKDVPRVLDDLAEQGRVMKLGSEFHLQTEEGAEWVRDFNQRQAAVRDDVARMSQLRNDWLLKAVDDELAGIKLVHGASKTPRKFERNWGDEEPPTDGTAIPVWIRDEWNITESRVKEAAARAGDHSPIVFVLLPKVDAEAIRFTLASHTAAVDTVTQRPEPQTDEGRQAKQGMQSRVLEGEQRLRSLFGVVISRARVFQGGGTELTTSSLRDGVETAGGHALTRQFGKFVVADNPNWGKVVTKARDGAPDALASVGWSAEVPANPVCKEVLARTSAAGTKGSELVRQLSDSPYGWPKDAIDGAVLALLANGNIRAQRDGQPVAGVKELPPTQIGKAIFYKEDEPPSMAERMAVRGVLTDAKVPYTAGQEGAAISGLLQHLSDLAEHAGGVAPLPAPPDTSHLDGLMALVGNQQFRAVAEAAERLRQDVQIWTNAGEQRAQRERSWTKLERLLEHARELDEAAAIGSQRDAVLSSRLLLEDPDTVAPLIDQVCDALRGAVTSATTELAAAYDREIAGLAASDEWQALDSSDRERLLKQAGLSAVVPPAIANEEELLRALDGVPIAAWKERMQALPAKVAGARAAAAKQLEPTSVAVKPANATLKTAADVESYLSVLRDQLMQHVDAGETVII